VSDMKIDDIEQVIKNPKAHFDDPFDVVAQEDLAHDERVRILESWKVDAEALERAEAENMDGGEEPQFRRVKEAIAALAAAPGYTQPASTFVAPPLGAPAGLTLGMVKRLSVDQTANHHPRSRKQVLGPDRKLLFALTTGVLVLGGLFFMLFGPINGDDGRVSTIGLGVIALEVTVLCAGLFWLVLVKNSKRHKSEPSDT